jgi:hypothetical protein
MTRGATSTEQLLANARARGFRTLDEAELVSWLHGLAESGAAVETSPGEWELTPAGRARFAPVGAMTPRTTA